jgi:hypothetical protein
LIFNKIYFKEEMSYYYYPESALRRSRVEAELAASRAATEVALRRSRIEVEVATESALRRSRIEA